jgi:hypothetical protein
MRGLMLGAIVFGVWASAPAAAQNPRFLCNSITGDGQVFDDGCGPCNGNTASRWNELQMTFSTNEATRPPELTLNEWRADYAASFGAWNDVTGHALTIFTEGTAAPRQFGVVNGVNSVFWIVDQADFEEQVGSGIDGILGVTLALDGRQCDDGDGRRSGFIDSDIAMNGTGFVANWNVTSVRSTLTHEMGHAIGIGHPCVDCSEQTLMSAISGVVESDVPLFPDQQAIRALYPGTPGALGTACTSDANCTDGPCVTVEIGGNNVRFCSQACGDCPSGFICSPVDGEGDVCVFANAGVAGPGEACDPPGCADACGAVEVICTSNAQCGADEICEVAGQDQQGNPVRACIPVNCNGCFQIDDAGNSQCFTQCDVDNPACPGGLNCLPLGAGSSFGVCSEGPSSCNEVTLTGCPPDQNCLGLQGGGAACFPGGNAGPGDTCTDDPSVCRANHLCVGVGGNNGECFRRCDDGSACPAGQTCQALNANLSICQTGGGGGEGEGEGGPGGEGEGEGGGGGDECDPARGNYDCPQGESCDDGVCENGEGPNRTFALCDNDRDCSGGICSNGVCTRPCDVSDGCPDGYRCEDEDDSGVPEGLCVANSCRDDNTICDADRGFSCQYSSAQRYVCAVGGSPTICNCSSTQTAPSDVSLRFGGALGVAAMVAALRRPRRGGRGEPAHATT